MPSPAEPILAHGLLPALQRQLLPVELTHPRPPNRHLAAVETDLALRSSPAMTAPVLSA
jgi:hypothetical protein